MFIKSTDIRANMMTSSNGNIFHVTGHLCGEFTGNRWIPRTLQRPVLTLFYPVQPETLAAIDWNLYVVLKCFIEKWIDVFELYKLVNML